MWGRDLCRGVFSGRLSCNQRLSAPIGICNNVAQGHRYILIMYESARRGNTKNGAVARPSAVRPPVDPATGSVTSRYGADKRDADTDCAPLYSMKRFSSDGSFIVSITYSAHSPALAPVGRPVIIHVCISARLAAWRIEFAPTLSVPSALTLALILSSIIYSREPACRRFAVVLVR